MSKLIHTDSLPYAYRHEELLALSTFTLPQALVAVGIQRAIYYIRGGAERGEARLFWLGVAELVIPLVKERDRWHAVAELADARTVVSRPSDPGRDSRLCDWGNHLCGLYPYGRSLSERFAESAVVRACSWDDSLVVTSSALAVRADATEGAEFVAEALHWVEIERLYVKHFGDET